MRNYISLGAGVQSSTMALMAAAGEITPMPDGAIFADTQSEPSAVYRWLDWLEPRLPFPVHRVTAGSLRESALRQHVSKKGKSYFRTAIPFHTKSPTGEAGMIAHRTCTRDYKLRPIQKAIRQLSAGDLKAWRKEMRALVKQMKKLVLLGATPAIAKPPPPIVTSWIGISLDEMLRMKPAREPWIACRWPLIEKRMTRHMCLAWMSDHGYPEPPRSACTFCPFHSAAEWRNLKASPEDWADAVDFDEEARQRRASNSTNMKSFVFVHRSLVPLSAVDVRNDVDHGQLLLWHDECTGLCGV